jgi:hypothetical protein
MLCFTLITLTGHPVNKIEGNQVEVEGEFGNTKKITRTYLEESLHNIKG